MTNTQQIEEAAVLAVRKILNDTGYIDASDIRSSDTMPIWDGHIFVYKDKSRRKATLKAKIAVQVKGTTKRSFNKCPSYAVERENLISYQNDGGCLYFVVFVDLEHSENNIVYYKSLLPYTISEILKENNDVHSPSFLLKKLSKIPEQCLVVVQNFIEDQKKQRAYIQNLNEYSIDDFKQLRYSYISSTPEGLIGQEVTLYGIKENHWYPCALGKVLDIQATVPKKVYLDDELWFDSFEISKSQPQSAVIINKNIRLIYENNKPKSFSIDFDGEISSIIKSLKFILALKRRPILKLGNVTGYLDFQDEPYSQLQEHLNHYELLENALKKANVCKDLKLNNVSQKDEHSITALINTMNFGKEISLNTNALCTVLNISICSQNLIFIAVKQQDKKYILRPFSENEQAACEHDGEKSPISPFIILKSIHLKHVLNINLGKIYTDVISYGTTTSYLNLVNDFVLETLIAYDETKEPELLTLAENLTKWLCEKTDSPSFAVFKLNELQIKKRQNLQLLAEDLNFLHQITENSDQNDLKYGAYTLLGDKFGAQKYFNKLSPEQQNFMKTKPIHTLFLKLQE